MKTFIKKILKKLFPSLAKKYFQVKYLWESKEEPVETEMGFKLAGNKSMQSGTFEPGETKIFNILLPSIDTLVNAGANIGYYCCLALKSNKQVIAFEPVHQNIELLLRNIKANNWEEGIEIYPIALGNKSGVIDIFGGGTGASIIKGWAGEESPSQLAPISTLDKIVGSSLKNQQCLVMVDIEGAEKSMLEGSKKMFDMQPKPIWLVEISSSAHQPEGVRINPDLLVTFQEFWNRGYEAWTTHKENRIVTAEEIKKIIAGGEDTIWGDTFLFLDERHHSNFKIYQHLKTLGQK